MLKPMIVACMALLATGASARDVLYPHKEGSATEESSIFKVLKLALEKADGDWTLKPTPLNGANQKRRLAMLKAGEELHVSWYGTSPELEETFNPVYFPIGGGLLGWRLLLISADQQEAFSKVETLEDLQAFSMGQGPGWSDIPILENAGLEVITSEKRNLYPMVIKGRIDAFPRSASEAMREHAAQSGELPKLAVEQSLVIHYPFANFFFTAPEQADLAAAIMQGLERAHADGSYQALYYSDPAIVKMFEQAHFGSRRVIDIENPNMSDAVKSIPSEYWYHPS